ncbi:Heterokaryon incompatibility protein Het-C [compost metagenome]
MNDPLDTAAETTDTATLASTFALDQLRNFAERLDDQVFSYLLRGSFGPDIAPETLIKLKQALSENTVRNPRYTVVESSDGPAAYAPDTHTIEVNRAAIEKALDEPETSAELLMAMIEVFALYIDAELRQRNAETASGDAPSSAEIAPHTVSVQFAQTLLFYNEPIEAGTPFAIYSRADSHQTLTLQRPAAHPAEGPEEPEGRSRKKRFAPESDAKDALSSFAHESIEQVLKGVGFNDLQCLSIYFGNWLRDYSQLIDAKIVRPRQDADAAPSELPDKLLNKALPRLSRKKLTAIVDLLSLKKFHSLQNTADGRGPYKVTESVLGVYRAHEHIDNPTTLDLNETDPQRIDRNFSPLVFPDDPRNSIMRKRSMKRYMRRPLAYMKKKLQAAKKEGMTPTGMRHFGEALHVLEDFFAHSNFVELALKRLGHHDVLAWTTPIESREQSVHEWPLITGMFGGLDIVASVIEPLAEHLFPSDLKNSEPLKPGERDDYDKLLMILLRDPEHPWMLSVYNAYLRARDQYASSWFYQLYSKVKQVTEFPTAAISYCSNMLKRPLLKFAGDQIATVQVLLDHDPNTHAAVFATHSQLAKDHDTHPFHTLAAELAKVAVTAVGKAMYDHWAGNPNADNDPAKIARDFVIHPNDAEWYKSVVISWAESNQSKIDQGTSIETLRALQLTEVEDVLKQLEKAHAEVEQQVKEIEELTGVSFLEIVYTFDAGPFSL